MDAKALEQAMMTMNQYLTDYSRAATPENKAKVVESWTNVMGRLMAGLDPQDQKRTAKRVLRAPASDLATAQKIFSDQIPEIRKCTHPQGAAQCQQALKITRDVLWRMEDLL